MLHVKYIGNIDSSSVLEKIKYQTIYDPFLHQNPLKKYFSKIPYFYVFCGTYNYETIMHYIFITQNNHRLLYDIVLVANFMSVL